MAASALNSRAALSSKSPLNTTTGMSGNMRRNNADKTDPIHVRHVQIADDGAQVGAVFAAWSRPSAPSLGGDPL